MGLRVCANRAQIVRRGVECARNVREMWTKCGDSEVLVFLAPSP